MRAFITGAGGGIGGAIKELYLHSGYEVVAPRSTELDLSDMSAIHDWFSSHRSEFDVIIHCAGYNRPLPAAEIPLEEFMKTQYVNYISLLEIVKANDAYFKEHGGYIVGIGSLYASISREGRAAYASSKHALVGLVKTLALEYGPYNVLCNTVSPGFVNTQMFQNNNNEAKRAELEQPVTELGGESLADALLAPTRIYVKPVLGLLRSEAGARVHAIAHITGGGITENLNRALAPDVDAVVERAVSPTGFSMGWDVPPVISYISRAAGLTPNEACKTFNMGAGLMVICPADAEDAVVAELEAQGERPFRVGTCVAGSGKVVYSDER